jgi:hypothetical protein
VDTLRKAFGEDRSSGVVVTATCVAVVVAVVAVLLLGIGYVFSAQPAFGFYYDLGVNVLATATLAHWIGSLADLKDSLGWAGWGDRTAFAFAPMAQYLITVPIAKVFGGDGMTAIKAMQAIEVVVAGVSAGYLYTVLRGRTVWAWVAGLTYALLPQTLTMIRGNTDFGLTTALAPLAAALSIALVRRWGLWALPLLGALASACSVCIAVEYAFFVGLPAYALALVLAYDPARRGWWLLSAAVGMLCLMGAGAYVALPTVASHAFFSVPSTIDVANQGGEFAVFSESIVALLALASSEFFVNARPEFTLNAYLPVALVTGLALWVLAIAWLRNGLRALAYGEFALYVVGGICIVLSTGVNIPGVGLVWWVISHLPGVDMIRTPDRFLTFAIAPLVIAAASTLQRLAQRQSILRFVALLGVASLAVGIVSLNALHLFSGDPGTVADHEPYLPEIDAVAQQRGGRVVNLAIVRYGSVFDTPLYGMPMPYVEFSSDFTQRYEGDGIEGTGMLARTNVSTVVASPPWAADTPLLGEAALSRAAFLHPLAGDATTAIAYGVEPARGYVHPAALACIRGGPGLLDYLVAMPAFADTAFLPGAQTCERAVYADDAPEAASLGGDIVGVASGVNLFAKTGLMKDIDYRIALGHFFLNVPWYRNAIDGDSPALSQAAVSVDPGAYGSFGFSAPKAGAYHVAIHALCRVEVTGRVVVDGKIYPFACKPQIGFQWISVALGTLASGPHSSGIAIEKAGSRQASRSTWKLAFDGLVAVRDAAVPASAQPAAFAYSAARLQPKEALAAPGDLELGTVDGFEAIGGESPGPLLARSDKASAHYRWSGPAGRYRVWAVAYVDAGQSGDAYLGIRGPHGPCCQGGASNPESGASTISASAVLDLRHGDEVQIVARNANSSDDPNASVELVEVDAEPAPLPATLTRERLRVAATFDFVGRMEHSASFIQTGPTPVPQHAGMQRYNGLSIGRTPLSLEVSFPASSSASPTVAQLDLAGLPAPASPAQGVARLICGDRQAQAPIGPPSSVVTLTASPSTRCRIEISSATPGMYVKRVSIGRANGSLDLSGRRWLDAGSYRISGIRRGTLPGGGVISIDGRAAGTVATIARSGWHEIAWTHAPSDAYLLAFVPRAWPASLPPVVTKTVASQRWRVTVAKKETLETAVFPDGYWYLTGNGAPLRGTACDLENTCFSAVPPGTYLLAHAWPGYIKLGFAITLIAWLVGIGTLLYARRRERALTV